MDDQIRREHEIYRIKGGCTAIVALFLQSKLYVSNAGDCRAIVIIFDLSEYDFKGNDVFIVASDGLWETVTNEKAQI